MPAAGYFFQLNPHRVLHRSGFALKAIEMLGLTRNFPLSLKDGERGAWPMIIRVIPGENLSRGGQTSNDLAFALLILLQMIFHPLKSQGALSHL